MYWEGNQEYFGFGCGAASYTQNIRFSRPKSIKKYYQFVDELTAGKSLIEFGGCQESKLDLINTVIMC